MTLAWFASEPHYRDHLLPIVEALDLGTGGWGNQHVLTARDADVVLVASRKDAKRFNRTILVEHGVGQRYGYNAGGVDTPEPQVELFLAPSSEVADRDAHLYPNARRVVVGSPRVEYLASLDRCPEKVVLAFHWESSVAREARSAWTHYHRRLDVLADYPMLGHGHPRMLRRLYAAYRKAHIPVEPEWAECVIQARVLVCDNSSIIYEAAAVGIPVVLLDAPWYSEAWGMRFWDHANMGPRVATPQDLPDAIDQVLTADRWEVRRAEVVREVYARVEGATVCAVEAIVDHLD